MPFLGITDHYIDRDWELKSLTINVVKLSSSHSGQNLSNVFIKIADDEFKILTKIMAVTTDNASNNDTFLHSLGDYCDKLGIDFKYPDKHIRCMAHIINLSVQVLLKGLKSKAMNTEVELLQNCNDNHEDASTGNVIFKLQKLFVKIGASPQKCEIFKNLLKQLEMDSAMPIIDVPTRWNSTYLMLEHALQLKTTLNCITSEESDL